MTSVLRRKLWHVPVGGREGDNPPLSGGTREKGKGGVPMKLRKLAKAEVLKSAANAR